MGIVASLHYLSKLSDGLHFWDGLESIIVLIVFVVLYIGIKLKKKWFIPLVLFSSAWFLVSTGFHIFQPVADVNGLILKIVRMMFFIFFLYQIYFLTRREVKAYFGVEETVFF
jgi:hypothetical protein